MTYNTLWERAMPAMPCPLPGIARSYTSDPILDMETIQR
jgi:hypothetical protein